MPPSYSPCPRPCLKRNSPPVPLPSPQDEPSTLLAIDPSILSPLVRFPPQPSLAHTLGSAIPYDRTPIVVQPNRCALPARGCPGRTYAPEDPSSPHRTKRNSLSPVRGRHLHPRAVEQRPYDDDPTPRQSPRDNHHVLPALVPDLSSSESSEESDGISSPPLQLYHASSSIYPAKPSLEQSFTNLSLAGTNAPSSAALSFLPHPPSPRVRPHHGPSPATSPSHSPTNSQYYMPSSLHTSSSNSNSSTSHGPGSPVRPRSPASPTHRRKPRALPLTGSAPTSPTSSQTHAIPIPASSSAPPTTAYMPMSPTMGLTMGVPTSPERERRSSRHREQRDDRERREHRERSRERKDQERAARLARYKSIAEASARLEESGCLGGF